MPLDAHRITYDKKTGKWISRRTGAQRATGIFDTKKVAVDKTRVVSRNQETELIVRNKNGQIGYRDSHGNDPIESKG
ncbi:MAG: DUF2188 domain-containing protein [Proteobacteria bacterium]|nr:DUF2188 domain-containing protein [Pseudomonadota bacterium]